MRKMMKLLVCLLIAAQVLAGVPAMAGQNENGDIFITLKPGEKKTVTNRTFCEISVKGDGYLIIQAKLEYGDTLFLIDSEDRSGPVWRIDSSLHSGKVIYEAAIGKGTYYLKSNFYSMTISYTWKKDPGGKNYTAKKAFPAKKNRSYTTIIRRTDKKKARTRVYKIRLKKAQKIHLKGNSLFLLNITEICNRKGECVCGTEAVVKNEVVKKRVSEEILPAGIYYLFIRPLNWKQLRPQVPERIAQVFSFSWY